MLKRPISLTLAFFLIITSTFALNGYWSDLNPSSIKSGNVNIPISPIQFTCENDPDYFKEYTQLTPPHGNLIQSCSCSQISADGSGRCIAQKCSISKDEAENNACWIINVNSIKIPYHTITQIAPYTYLDYKAQGVSLNANTNQPSLNYQLMFDLEMDVKSGIKADINIQKISEQSGKFTINYDNEILDGLQGGIEVNQINGLFRRRDTVKTINFTFIKGRGTVTTNLDNIYGNKEIVIVPFVKAQVIDGKGVIQSDATFAGNEYTADTTVAVETSTSGTITYYPLGGSYLVNAPPPTKQGFFASFINWFKNLINKITP